jgi:hypothetical protein
MLTFEDCLAFCSLTEAEIAAVAEHERLPLMAAAEYGEYLIHLPDGEARIKRIILEDIATAQDAGDHRHAMALRLVLREFVRSHSAPTI